MEKLPASVEREMSEVSAPTFNSSDKAYGLIKDIAGHTWRGRGDMIDRVYSTVADAFPKSRWTRRRIRALWHREAARIDWREVRELEFVAEVERAERLRREAARARHNEFIQQIADTLDRMEATDAEFYGAHRAALREMASRPSHSQIRNTASESDQNSDPRCRDFASFDQ